MRSLRKRLLGGRSKTAAARRNGLPRTLGYYRAPLIIAAIGTVLSLLTFVNVRDSQADEHRRAFLRIAEIQAQLLAAQFRHADRQLRQLAAYVESVETVDRARFEVFASRLLTEDGLSYLGWAGRSGEQFGLWQGSKHSVKPRRPPGETPGAVSISSGAPTIALTHIGAAGGQVTQLLASLPVANGGGTVLGRINFPELVAGTLNHADYGIGVVRILDHDGQLVFRVPAPAGDGVDAAGEAAGALEDGYYVARTLVLFGQLWTLEVLRERRTGAIGHAGSQPWLALAFGLSMTVLIGFIAFQQARQTATVHRRVADQTFAIRLMAEASTRTESRLQAIFDTSVDGLITIDSNGIVENYNPACERMFGYTAREVVGNNISMLMPPPTRDVHDTFLRHYLESGDADAIGVNREVRAQRKDGSVFPMELAISEMREGNNVRFSGVIRDITERNNLLQGLRETNNELERFAYVASHDLKAPLRAIDNLSQWIEEDLGDVLQSETREHMQLLRSRVGRMDRLLDDLLEYSRAGRKDCEATFEIVSARAVVDDVLLLIAPPDDFEIIVDDALDTCEVNRMPLQQVLFNLVNNAVKHHDRGQGRIVIDGRRADEEYEFSVTDDGPGIAPAYHARVFEMFQTLRPRDAIEGSGMGLALVKKVVEQQGGTIRIAAQPGRGSRFVFSWPYQLREVGESHAA